MSNMIRCDKGHFYDSDRYENCPYCNQQPISAVGQDTVGEDKFTLPIQEKIDNIPKVPGELTGQAVKTVGFYDKIDPVVGWLVCIAGSQFGEDFKLKTGRNFIGRSPEMDIVLKDITVSRDKHAIIVYEPKGNKFLVQPGDAKELFYINDDVVLSAKEITANDVMTVGNTILMFIPCCSDKFNWDSVMPAEDKSKEKKE